MPSVAPWQIRRNVQKEEMIRLRPLEDIASHKNWVNLADTETFRIRLYLHELFLLEAWRSKKIDGDQPDLKQITIKEFKEGQELRMIYSLTLSFSYLEDEVKPRIGDTWQYEEFKFVYGMAWAYVNWRLEKDAERLAGLEEYTIDHMQVIAVDEL